MIRPQPFPSSPSYQAVIRALLRMHQFAIEMQEESDEAEALRASMSEPWEALSKIERDRVTGLSKDLYEISDQRAQVAESMNPQAQTKVNEAYEARNRGEWDRALELLRQWGKHLTPALLSYIRGTIWRSAGDPMTASVFFQHACRLDSDNENYQAVLLHTLKAADPHGAATRAEQVLHDSEVQMPAVVAYAADILFASVQGAPAAEATPTYQRLIPIMERTLARLEERVDVDGPVLVGMALALLASCHEGLGDTRAAYNYYSRAIHLDPTNDLLLVARGKLLYGANPNAAADFELAVRLGSQVVWPYFYLAHHYLANNRFEECRSMCERALQRAISRRVKSDLYDFLAVSLSGLGYPVLIIQRAFENAIRVDPSNDRARRNLEKFEMALAAPVPQRREWERLSESSLRAFSQEQSECSEDPAAHEHALAKV